MKEKVKLKKGAGIIFEAVPDDGEINVQVGQNRRPQYVWPNRMVLPNGILERLRKNSATFFYPPPSPIEYRGANWIINMCADPDEYHNALIGLDEAFGETLPIFNHPRAVALSRRDIVARQLKGVSHLTVPMSLRFTAHETRCFQKAFDAGGFKYPVLVRPATSQSGRGLLKIDTPFDWQKIYLTHWHKRSFYMSQFVDYRSADGVYRKVRIRFIEGQPRIRGWQESRDWLLTGSRTELLDDRPGYLVDTIQSLATNEKFLKMREELACRLPLDFFGADIGVRGDEFILFEATAAMTMASQSEDHEKTSPLMRRVYQEIEADLNRVLFLPQSWSDKAMSLPSVRTTLEE
jgi:hypothetical protein